MKYYISDTHFDHQKIITYDNRPFRSAEEMNYAMIENWNQRVTSEDHVYVLGDFHWGKATKWVNVLKQLNGNIHLVRGNHDLRMPIPTEVRKYFVDVSDYKEIEDGENHIVLCHFPMPVFKNMYYGWLHFYGHVHNGTENNITENFCRQVADYYEFPPRAFNVGCMMPYMAYTLRTAKEIIVGGTAYRQTADIVD